MQVCTACHGPNGNSTDPQYPVLAGQNARYIYLQLRDFKEGRRHDPQMDPMAASLTRDDMLALADFFSKQKQASTSFKADPAKVAAGKKKTDEVLCPMCHLGEFAGQNEIPRVAGQHYAYVKKQLGDFKAQARAVFQAVKAQVEAGGGTMDSIVKINTYLTDIRHRADLVPIREEFLGKKSPASTLVAVAALAMPEWLIEIEAVAVL